MTDKAKQITLGTEKVSKLLMEYSLPAIIGQIAASLYNIVDSIFIGQGCGPMAISGLAITFPIMNMAIAFGAMVGVGGSTLMSIKMGQNDDAGATKVLGNVTVLNVIIGTVLMVFGLALLDPILYLFGASENTIPYARDYMEIILAGNVMTHMYFGLNSTMRSSGYPKKAMYITLLTVVVNAILDPLFIFVLDWGIRGAAFATVLSQALALVVVMSHFCKKDSFIHYQRSALRLDRNIVTGIFSIGMAPFVMNFCACFTSMLIILKFEEYGGDLSIGAFGINNRMIMLFVMLVLGFNQGMQPIAGFNYGAKKMGRVKEVLKLTVFCGCAVTSLAFVAGMFFPKVIVSLFTTDEQLISLSVSGMRIMVAVFPIVGFQMVVANFFQSIGQSVKSVFLSSTRQLLLLIPCLFILPRYFGLEGVWMSMPVSDFVSTIMAVIILFSQRKMFSEEGRA